MHMHMHMRMHAWPEAGAPVGYNPRLARGRARSHPWRDHET